MTQSASKRQPPTHRVTEPSGPVQAYLVGDLREIIQSLRESVPRWVQGSRGCPMSNEIDGDHTMMPGQIVPDVGPRRRAAGEPVQEHEWWPVAMFLKVKIDAVSAHEGHLSARSRDPIAAPRQLLPRPSRCWTTFRSRSVTTSTMERPWCCMAVQRSRRNAQPGLGPRMRCPEEPGRRADIESCRRAEERLEHRPSSCSACGRNEKMPPPLLLSTTMVALRSNNFAASIPLRS